MGLLQRFLLPSAAGAIYGTLTPEDSDASAIKGFGKAFVRESAKSGRTKPSGQHYHGGIVDQGNAFSEIQTANPDIISPYTWYEGHTPNKRIKLGEMTSDEAAKNSERLLDNPIMIIPPEPNSLKLHPNVKSWALTEGENGKPLIATVEPGTEDYNKGDVVFSTFFEPLHKKLQHVQPYWSKYQQGQSSGSPTPPIGSPIFIGGATSGLVGSSRGTHVSAVEDVPVDETIYDYPQNGNIQEEGLRDPLIDPIGLLAGAFASPAGPVTNKIAGMLGEGITDYLFSKYIEPRIAEGVDWLRDRQKGLLDYIALENPEEE